MIWQILLCCIILSVCEREREKKINCVHCGACTASPKLCLISHDWQCALLCILQCAEGCPSALQTVRDERHCSLEAGGVSVLSRSSEARSIVVTGVHGAPRCTRSWRTQFTVQKTLSPFKFAAAKVFHLLTHSSLFCSLSATDLLWFTTACQRLLRIHTVHHVCSTVFQLLPGLLPDMDVG